MGSFRLLRGLVVDIGMNFFHFIHPVPEIPKPPLLGHANRLDLYPTDNLSSPWYFFIHMRSSMFHLYIPRLAVYLLSSILLPAMLHMKSVIM